MRTAISENVHNKNNRKLSGVRKEIWLSVVQKERKKTQKKTQEGYKRNKGLEILQRQIGDLKINQINDIKCISNNHLFIPKKIILQMKKSKIFFIR